MTTSLTRADLAAIPGMTPKVIRAFEDLPQRISDTETQTATAVASTRGLNEATVLVLSGNDAFDNERILAVGTGLYLTDGGPGGILTLHLTSPIKINGAYMVTLNAPADINLDLPVNGEAGNNDSARALRR